MMDHATLGEGLRTPTPEPLTRGRITLARIATALGVEVGSAPLRVGLHRLAREAAELAVTEESLRPAADALKPLVAGLVQRDLELAQSESHVCIAGAGAALGALLEPPPPYLPLTAQRTWRERRLQIFLAAVARGGALPEAVAKGLLRLGTLSSTALRAAPLLSGPASAIPALVNDAPKWLRPIAQAFHSAAVYPPVVRPRHAAPSAPGRTPRQRKYRSFAQLKPLIVRALRLRRAADQLMQGSFTVAEPQWRAIAARLRADLKSARAAFACAVYFSCRFQLPPRHFNCVRLGSWRPGGETWLDLGVAAGHLSMSLADLTRTPSRWPAELAQRGVLFIPVDAIVLDYLRQRATGGGALDLSELLVGPDSGWMGEFEHYLHGLAISNWPVTLERLLVAFPEYVAGKHGNEVAIDAALAFGGLASLSHYHYCSIRSDRLRSAANAIDRLLLGL